MAQGLQFDFNYTLSKSIDMASDAERVNTNTLWNGLGGQIINSWNPRGGKGRSDFDSRHQINANWTYDMPFGSGKKWGGSSKGFVNALIGGWSLSGLVRWANGYPFGVNSGSQWATNWQLSAGAILDGSKPPTGVYIVTQDGTRTIRAFKDPAASADAFRQALPGESGMRNIMTGPGFFGLDTGVGKAWKITERQSIKFRWETFNVTNSARFDTATMSASLTNKSNFGRFSSTLTDKRVMQFALRYEF
jgi:hypothetical protein